MRSNNIKNCCLQSQNILGLSFYLRQAYFNSFCKFYRGCFKFSRIKEAEQLGFQPEDNTFIFNEIMKNDIIREEFEKIREQYGEEAFELNKLSLLNFIKKGR